MWGSKGVPDQAACLLEAETRWMRHTWKVPFGLPACFRLCLQPGGWFDPACQHGMSSQSSTGPPAFAGIAHPRQCCSVAGAALVLHPVPIVDLAFAVVLRLCLAVRAVSSSC